MNSLQTLFNAIEQTRSQTELRSQIAVEIGRYFTAKRTAIFLFNQLYLENSSRQKLWNLALSVEYNPVARYIAQRHAPVHEGLVTTPQAWQLICPRQDHRHVMAGPIVSCGRIVGAVGCTRDSAIDAFNQENLIDLSAICLHISVWMATQSQFNCSSLTPRELEIADLVASGKTNAEIGRQLWITENSVKQALKRMFRKLQVSSRAEMVARLLQK